MSKTEAIIKQALTLSSQDKITLIEKLTVSLQESDPEIESLWKKEVERRIDAWESMIKSTDMFTEDFLDQRDQPELQKRDLFE